MPCLCHDSGKPCREVLPPKPGPLVQARYVFALKDRHRCRILPEAPEIFCQDQPISNEHLLHEGCLYLGMDLSVTGGSSQQRVPKANATPALRQISAKKMVLIRALQILVAEWPVWVRLSANNRRYCHLWRWESVCWLAGAVLGCWTRRDGQAVIRPGQVAA